MAIDQLRQGYERFREGAFETRRSLYEALGEGQSPKVMVIGCADSRVDPELLFDAGPGELFVVRNVANLVPPVDNGGRYHGTSAAIEFAVTALKVEAILVLGHARCGGIEACLSAAENKPVGRFIAPWVEIATTAREALVQEAGPDQIEDWQQALEHRSIRQSLDHLHQFDFVAAAIKAKRLALHGAWFSISTGKVLWLDEADGTFKA